jgi:ribonuclease R
MAKRKSNPEEKRQQRVASIMNVLNELPGSAFNYKEITEMIGLKSKADRMEVQDCLFDMVADGLIEETIAGKYRTISTEVSGFKGVVDMTAAGYAFIILDKDIESDNKPEEDIFVSHKNLNGALDGDKVIVRVFASKRGRQIEGEVVQIVKRKRVNFVGRVEVHTHFTFLVCDLRITGGRDIVIPTEKTMGAKNGQKAIAKITSWPEGQHNPIGEIIQILGDVGDNETEMHAILAEFDLPYSYPEDVARAAESIEPGITKDEVARRRDMRGVTTFTIDPADAKDFDDALSIQRLPNGNWEVGIHIADVTHYVTPGSIVDEEGYKRATSIYLVDRTIPMLPERLSNFICSLRPDEEKLTFSVIVEMDDNAEVLNTEITKTVICSNRRFTYEEAQEIIEGADGDYKEEILKMNDLAQKLRRKRFEKGAINFERSEVRFKIDETGKPVSVYFKESKEANKLVEEFMLLANRRVAETIGADEINPTKRKRTPKTFVYRVHDQPNEEKFGKFATFVRRFGYEAMPKKGEQINNAVNRILCDVKGKGEQNLIEILAVRTMAKAVYTTKNIGHYGLAFEYYTHFTSPIRRYPDMMVHRLLFSYLGGGKSEKADKYEEMCEHSSEQEILASEAERASIKYKQVEFMIDHIGEEFDATVSGVTEWGLFAEIDENHCEGMVPLRDLEDDRYFFDEDNYYVIGQNTNKKYQLGDKIRIRIANADLERKQLDFTIAGSPFKAIEVQNMNLKAKGRRPGISRYNVGQTQAKEVKKSKASGKPPKSVLKKAKKNKAKSKKKGKKRK